MKPITITLTTTIDEEIDAVLYGMHYAFSRIHPDFPNSTRPWIQPEKDGPWVPTLDWKLNEYGIKAHHLRNLARHFIEVGKHLSGLIDLDEICRAAGISEPYMDGNQWCILKGANIQEGVVGFGDTKEEALVNFIKDITVQEEAK